MARTQAERSESTSGQIIEAARQLFTDPGYADASIDGIVRAAGMTKGALYHHFDTKADLFRAVFESEEGRLAARLSAAARRQRDPWSQLRAGCRAFLEACLDPSVRRIKMLDGPAVLGWDEVREIEAQHTIAMLRDGIAAAISAGLMVPGHVEARTNLLVGALCDGGMWVARSTSPQPAVRVATEEVELLLAGFRTP